MIGGGVKMLNNILGSVVDKILDYIPNPNERAKAKEMFEMELMKMVMNNANKQIEVNKVESAHKSLFVAGWRPFLGWTCGISLCWVFLIVPVLEWILILYGYNIELPDIETDYLFQLILAMLGLGGLRTFEKIKGVARER
jgi:hypothetical protein